MELRPIAGFASRLALLPLLTGSAFLVLAPSVAQAQCSEQTTRGRVTSVDMAQGRFFVQNNLTGAPGLLFGVDGGTDFRGVARSLAELQPGYDVDLRYCFNTNPRRVLRVTSSLPAAPPAGALVVDLRATPGQESIPVTRVFGDDVGESLGGFHGDGMAFGDVNGDGFDDAILVGGRPGVDFTKAVVVVYGGSDLAGASLDLDSDGAVSPHGETRLQPTVPFQNVGLSVGCGDLDGDGFDDVFVGEDAGTHVVFGRADLPASVVALDPSDSGSDRFRLSSGRLPAALAAGDLNADGFEDLVADAGPQGVLVLFGRSDLRGSSVDTGSGTGPVAGVARILTTGLSGDGHVTSLDTGDVNGDGFDDLVIALQRGISPSLTSAVVVYGSAALPGTVVSPGLAPTGSPAHTSVFGRGLDAAACGDFDGDGYDDVLLATAGIAGPGDNFAVGAAHVIYGGASLPGTSLSLLDPVGPNETRLVGLEEFGEFGSGLAAADLDGDGRHDLVLPAPGSVPFGTLPETNTVSDGAIYVLRGRAGLRGQELLDPREVADVYVFAAATNDRFGAVVAAGGDLDRDGLPEMAGSAEGGDNPALIPNNGAGYASFLFRHGLARSASVSVRRTSRAGDGPGGSVVPPADFGPVVRVAVDFADDDLAPGSRTTATLVRQGLPGTARATWFLQTARSGWTSAELTFRYSDAEIAGLREGRLGVYRGADVGGPFFLLPSRLDPARNEIHVRVKELGIFLLAEQPKMRPATR